jgi:hypothetical protein
VLQRTADMNAAAAAQQLTEALGRASELEGTVVTLREAAEAAAKEREQAAEHARTLAAEVVASRQQAAAQAESLLETEKELQVVQAEKRAAEEALAAAQVTTGFPTHHTPKVEWRDVELWAAATPSRAVHWADDDVCGVNVNTHAGGGEGGEGGGDRRGAKAQRGHTDGQGSQRASGAGRG